MTATPSLAVDGTAFKCSPYVTLRYGGWEPQGGAEGIGVVYSSLGAW